MKNITIKPIGYLKTSETNVPRHFSVSDVAGEIVVDKKYLKGLRGIKPGDRILVVFHFHKSPEFSDKY
ncbi:MAG: tRNA (N6-threonylcarbamoyladenosine(37)-N6)-methyltransferase TrmO, partial [Nitrospirae bacterium]